MRLRRLLLTALYLLSLAALAAAYGHGKEYYATPLVERPHHDLHWELKPGGSVGRTYGVVGAVLMLALLGYPLRKRWRLLRRAGRMALWLDVHIYFGVVGPLLVVLHTAFKVQGLVAVAFWSMVAVAGSGIFGRFLYGQIPRSAAGDELTLAEATALDRELATELRGLGLTADQLARLDAVGGEGWSADAGTLALVARLPFEPIRFSARLARFRRECRGVPRELLARFARLARQKALLRRRLLLWSRLHELFHYWHVLHKPFAVLMYLFVAIHVGVAWMTGYAGGLP